MKAATAKFIGKVKRKELKDEYGKGANIVPLDEVIRLVQEFEIALLKQWEKDNGKNNLYADH